MNSSDEIIKLGDIPIEFDPKPELVEVRPGRHCLSILHITCSQPTDRTMFFIHGSMANMNQFKALIAFFKDNYNIVAYDALGCGTSPKPHEGPWLFGLDPNYSQEHLTADAVAIYNKYATAKNILIGHSYGTTQVARIIAAESGAKVSRTSKIAGCILLGTAIERHLKHSIFNWPVWILQWLHPVMSKNFVSMALSPAASDSLRNSMLSSGGTNDMYVCQSFYLQAEWATEDQWAQLGPHRVLVIQGADDKITTLDSAKQLVEVIQAAAPAPVGDAFVDLRVLADCGHMIVQEKPQETIAIMQEYLLKIKF